MHIIIWKSINSIDRLIRRLVSYSEIQCLKSAMKHCGKNFKFENGVRFEHPEFVDISDDVTINSHAWFSIIPIKGGVDAPSLKIGKGTYIGRFATIACINRIVIGDDVLISDRVFISDALHGYSDITRPVLCQPLYSPGPVEIGSGTWIGIGVSILPNVRIGENCVIGANAVVTCDVPDYHVAVGVPAHIVGRVDRCRG